MLTCELFYCTIFMGFLKKKNQKLVLSTNKMLYLQKQPLVGTL